MVYENEMSPYHEQLMSPNSPQHFVTVDQHGNTVQKFGGNFQQQQSFVIKGQHRYVPYTNRMVSPIHVQSSNFVQQQQQSGVPYQQQQSYCPSRTPPVGGMFSPSGGSERSCSVPLSSPYLVHEEPPSPMFNIENVGTQVRGTMPLRPSSQMSVSSMPSPLHVPSSFSNVNSEHNYGQEMFNNPQQQPQMPQIISHKQQTHTENDIKLMIIRKIAEQLELSARNFDPNPIIIPKMVIRSTSLDSNDSMPDLEPLVNDPYTIEDILEVIERDIQETRQMFPHKNFSTIIHHRPGSTIIPQRGPSQVIKIIKQQQPKTEKIIDFEAVPVKGGRKTQTTQKRFQCIVCKKQFAGGSHLRNHFKTAVHRNEVLNTNQPDPVDLPDTWRIDEHICNVCSQTFSKRECLLKHMALHNNDGSSQS